MFSYGDPAQEGHGAVGASPEEGQEHEQGLEHFCEYRLRGEGLLLVLFH